MTTSAPPGKRGRLPGRLAALGLLAALVLPSGTAAEDGGQFCDHGDSYRSAIFVATEEERRLAEESKAKVA